MRSHYKLFDKNKNNNKIEIGEVSSGIHSHNLGKGIGMGFVSRK